MNKINRHLTFNNYLILIIITLLISCKSNVENIRNLYSNGNVYQEFSLTKGIKEGVFTEYYLSGHEKITANYKNGLLNGDYYEYYEKVDSLNDGSIVQHKSISCTYKNGELDGLYEEIFENGNAKYSVTYYHGKKIGPEDYFNKDSVKIKECLYILRDKKDSNQFRIQLDTTNINDKESYLNMVAYFKKDNENRTIINDSLGYFCSQTYINDTIILGDSIDISYTLASAYFKTENKIVDMKFENNTNDKISLYKELVNVKYPTTRCVFYPSKKGDGILWGLINEMNLQDKKNHFMYVRFDYYVK